MTSSRRHLPAGLFFLAATWSSAAPAWAQTADDGASAANLGRVEITGSAIRRINAEASLPVQVITSVEIKRMGVTSTTELIQNLPAMQGFTTSSQSVNGGGGGIATASIHGLGNKYTLVLLNGHRMTAADKGATVDLNNIPLNAIERVEVLTDGASALYGSDAIAGVVNFILKNNTTAGSFDASGSVPQHPGGKEYNVAVSKGFGDINVDKFNVLLAASYEKQEQLKAAQRGFARSGVIPFSDSGRDLSTLLLSSNSIPANVTVRYKVGDTNKSVAYSPYYLGSGKCAANTYLEPGGQRCLFDYPSTVQAIPETERMNVLGSGHLALTDSATLFAETLLSTQYTQARYAPPAQPLALTQTQFNKYVTPYLSQLGVNPATVYGLGSERPPTAAVRVFDAGGREDKYQTDTGHFVLGVEGTGFGWDYDASGTYSASRFHDIAVGGYLDGNQFNTIVQSGAYDPMASFQGQSVGLLAPAVLHQTLDTSRSSLAVLSAKASRPLLSLPGGPLALALGGEYRTQRYKESPSAILQGANALQPDFSDVLVGGSQGTLPFDAKRHASGVFTEIVAPITKELELDGSVRYDNNSAVTNAQNFDAAGNPISPATQGKSSSAPTYKLSLRFQPMKELLVRGSIGSGFRAPTLGNISNPAQFFGVTGLHKCPINLPAALAQYCESGNYEYNVIQGGNAASGDAALKPEKSRQWTAGFRYEPSELFSGGVDIWNVYINDTITTVPEDSAFANGAAYASLFTLAKDPATGVNSLTFLSAPINSGKSHYEGLDFTVESRVGTPIGKLSTHATATYMMKADYELPGSPGYQNSLGKIGPDTNVVFRWQGYFSTSLESGALTNTFALTFKSSYQDEVFTADDGTILVRNPDGTLGDPVAVNRRVASYTLIDWQGKYAVSNAVSLTAGVKNIFNRDPPLTIQDLNGTGNFRGYDGRYTNPLGRTFYVAGNYKF